VVGISRTTAEPPRLGRSGPQPAAHELQAFGRRS
jgi:hypothetical protein